MSELTGPQGVAAFQISRGALPHDKLCDRQDKLLRTLGVDPLAETRFTTRRVAAAVESVSRSENMAPGVDPKGVGRERRARDVDAPTC